MKIFISHSSKDNSIVRKIVDKLDEYEIDHWVDIKELRGEGHSIGRDIDRGFENCTHFLLVWSKHSKKSRWVEKERSAATSDEYNDMITKIIFRLDNAPLPLSLTDFHSHPVTEENVFEEITGVIKNIMETDEAMLAEFNSYLDQTNEDVSIDEVPYSFSKILKCADMASYKIRFHEWKSEELERRIEEFYQMRNSRTSK